MFEKNGNNLHTFFSKLKVSVQKTGPIVFSHLQNVEKISAGFWKHLLSSVYMNEQCARPLWHYIIPVD